MKNYKKYYEIAAIPEEIYRAMTNPLAIQLWTGEEAVMSTEPNSEFELFDGSICGRNLEFEENKKIVQEWYFENQGEASIVTIKIHPHPSGSSVELRHSNIPNNDFEDIVEGWNEVYFDSLIEFFEEEE